MSDAQDKMLKSADVCRMLNIDPSTLYRWRRDNHNLPFYRVGGQVRYRESDVLAYLGVGRHDPEESNDGDAAQPGPE